MTPQFSLINIKTLKIVKEHNFRCCCPTEKSLGLKRDGGTLLYLELFKPDTFLRQNPSIVAGLKIHADQSNTRQRKRNYEKTQKIKKQKGWNKSTVCIKDGGCRMVSNFTMAFSEDNDVVKYIAHGPC